MRKEERKQTVKIYLKLHLKDLLQFAKKGNEHIGYKKMAIEQAEQIQGMIQYAMLVEDISEETNRKISKLIWTIRKKYNIY